MKINVSKEDFLSSVSLKDGEIQLTDIKHKIISFEQLSCYPRALPMQQPLSGVTVAERIWHILCQPNIMKSRAEDLSSEAVEKYIKKITLAVDKGNPVPLVFIGLPFKARQNPLKTNRRTPDLGELFMLRRLLDISMTVRQVYTPGIQWTVVLEGEAYRNLFGVSKDEVAEYRKVIEEFILRLNGTGDILLSDLACLSAKYDNLDERVGSIYQELKNLHNSNQTVSAEFATIYWTMRNSMNTQNCSSEELYYLSCDDCSPDWPMKIQTLWHDIAERALDVTLRYLAFNKVKNNIGRSGQGLITDSYPDHCYVSITPKVDRYAFYPLSKGTKFFPHHGVPILVGKRNGFVKVVFLVDIATKKNNYRAVYIDADQEQKPFFYQQMENHNGYQLSGGWNYGY